MANPHHQPPSTSKRGNFQVPPNLPEAHREGVSVQIRLVDSAVHPETPPFLEEARRVSGQFRGIAGCKLNEV